MQRGGLSTQGLNYADVERGGIFGVAVTHSAITLRGGGYT